MYENPQTPVAIVARLGEDHDGGTTEREQGRGLMIPVVPLGLGREPERITRA